MSITVTDYGIEIEKLSEKIARLEGLWKSIYGADINLSPETPDGQLIHIIAQEMQDISEASLIAYNGLNPLHASRNDLDRAAIYKNLTRKNAQYSYCDSVEFTGKNVVIKSGSKFKSKNGDYWVIDSDLLVNNENTIASLRSEKTGIFTVTKGEVFTPAQVPAGLVSVTNTAKSIDGRLVESDVEFRKRVLGMGSVNAESDSSGVEKRIINNTGAILCKVYENNESIKNAIGVEAKSIWCIAVGGDNESIAKEMLKYKVGGVAFQGDTEVSVTVNNTPRLVKFSRGKQLTANVLIKVKKIDSSGDVDTDAIKESLSVVLLGLGEELHALSLMQYLMHTQNAVVTEIIIDGAPSLSAGVDEYIVVSKDSVTVELV